jgi:serine/threonine-protein kinase HipA
MSLGVFWDGEEVGSLQLVEERSREYFFQYSEIARGEAARAISLSLPISEKAFTPAQSRPFFDALLPEGAVRERIASQLKLASSDSYGLLAELGRDCAGALQILDAKRASEAPSVHWLDGGELDALIEELPRHPLGMRAADERLRLSLAGVQNKAVLLRDRTGQFGKPLDGMPSSHILKPEPRDGDYPGLAANEYFCMRLAARCGLPVAEVQLIELAGRPCLVVERFDRELSSFPPVRVHQEDLCQALGLTPDFKYQQEGWRLPSYAALAELLDEHSPSPGLDRLAGAQAAVFHYLVGNADAHAKNISLIHGEDGVRLAPLYDVVCTAAYPELDTRLALSIGDETDPDSIASIHFADLADDFSLNAKAFARECRRLSESVAVHASRLREEALAEGWHQPCVERVLEVIASRVPRVAAVD